MTDTPPALKAAVSAGTLAATALIAHQVAGKAVRDTLFLSHYDVTDLPLMLVVASVASVATVLVTSQAITRLGPARLIPRAFLASAALQLGWWGLYFVAPTISAVAMYLHMTMFGAVLISGFWSMVNERFDPRTAKRAISKIAAGGTLGGLLGGLLAERLGAMVGSQHVVVALGALHLYCGWRVMALSLPPDAEPKGPDRRALESTQNLKEVRPRAPTSESPFAGLSLLLKQAFLRNIGLMIMLGTLSAAFLDYVFKVEATAAYRHDQAALMRVFAGFYTITGLITFLVQTTLSARALERLGIARTVATLPLSVGAGALGALLIPGLWVAAAARGAEAIVRSSVFRSAYELLYTPVPPHDKRQAKTIIDVGFDRLGDALGGALVTLVLWLSTSEDMSRGILLVAGAGMGLVGVLLAFRLQRGYVKALEVSLLNRAVELDLAEVQDSTTRSTVMLTLVSQGVDRAALEEALRSAGAGASMTTSQLIDTPALRARIGALKPPRRETDEGSPPSTSGAPAPPLEPVVQTIIELRSGDPERVREALSGTYPLDRLVVAQLIPLLAWDDMFPNTLRCLRRLAPECTGQLTDALLDAEEEFAVRRRLPRALVHGHPQRALEALIQGLGDRRFEVRYQCGHALSRLRREHPELEIDPDRIYPVIRQETRVGRRVWAGQRLLDQLDQFDSSSEGNPFVDEFIKHRTSRSLQHVFTLLSLILPRQPLTIAYRGLHTDDPTLRGTALEYLESVLPPDIRAPLWPFLEDPREVERPSRSRDEVLDELVKSNESIQLNLAALRARLGEIRGESEGGSEEG